MFKVTSNTRMVAFQLDKSMKAKKRGINKAINNTLKSIHRDAKNNANNVRNKEAKGLADAIEIDLKNKIVGVNNEKAGYAPFVEFGTKAGYLASPPQTRLRPIAARYKGTPVDWKDLVDRVASGGASKPKQYARKLTLKGTTPEPFFYNAVFSNKPVLRRELKKALRKRV